MDDQPLALVLFSGTDDKLNAAAVMAAGIEQAISQCRELLERGAPGIHFYTLNKSHATRSVLSAIL